MIINNAINSPLPTSFAKGGTNAGLTPSNGGILYSTDSAGSILANTVTSKQGLMSGSSSFPSWSTATYPSIIPINELLYSSANNIVSGLSTTSTTCLVTDNSGVPTWLSSMENGQVIIGNTGNTPIVATLTGGTNVNIENSVGSITINSTAGGGGNWELIDIQTASNSASLNFDNKFNSYYISYCVEVTNLLPQSTFKNTQLLLRLGTGINPIYISSGYIYQLCDINSNGSRNTYPGYSGSPFNEALLTNANGNGISFSFIDDGVSGTIYLFITSGSTAVGSGISQMAYMSFNEYSYYANTSCSFQQPAANFTSFQLLMSQGNIASGSASLYGLSVG